MKVTKAQITGKNLQMNEDTWESLDTREWRDHELIRGYLNDPPVKFGEQELKVENEKYSEMMAFGLSIKEATPEMHRVVEKYFHNQKQLWVDGIKLKPWNLKRMEQDLRELLLWSSKSENDDKKHHRELLRYFGMTN